MRDLFGGTVRSLNSNSDGRRLRGGRGCGGRARVKSYIFCLLGDIKVDTNGFGLVFSVFVRVTGNVGDIQILEVRDSDSTDRILVGNVK